MPGVPMAHLPNPDRNSSAGRDGAPTRAELRDLLDRVGIADLFDATVRQRVGQAIARAVRSQQNLPVNYFNSAK
jgi:hypothetical protein